MGNMSIYDKFMLLILILVMNIVTSLEASNNETASDFDGTNQNSSKLHTSLDEHLLPQHKGREHVTLMPQHSIDFPKKSKVLNLTKLENPEEVKHKISAVVTENKSSPRPDVLSPNKNSTANQVANTTISASIIKSSTTEPSSTKPPKKTTTVKPHKPLKTVHDETPVSNEEKLELIIADIPSIDDSLNKKTKRADYIIPIVAVILSVPLVTIIISVLYKRSKDWWQHRNYRRMDYLIEGMYNS